MKKLLALFAVMALALTLTACGGEAKLPADGEITMENLDEYMGRDNVQYIDLRNLDDRLKDGYVSGFTVIPYFDYLNTEEIITGKADTTTVVDSARVKQLFDEEAEAIFLMCASGGRAGWVKGALEGLGYTNVFNVGGFKDYAGDHKVSGDGSYVLSPSPYGDYTPGTYVGFSDGGYSAYVTIGEHGGIVSVVFDAVYCSDGDDDGIKETCNTKQDLGADYDMGKFSDPYVQNLWTTHADLAAAAVVEAGGWIWTLEAHEGSDHMYFGTDGVAGVTIGVEGFKAALEAALALAE